jgi:hypothetical protein
MCEVDGAAISDLEDSVSDTIPYDGVSHWDAISSAEKAAQEPPARRELVLDHCLAGFSTSGTGCNHYGVNHSVGAIIHVSMHAHIYCPHLLPTSTAHIYCFPALAPALVLWCRSLFRARAW